MPLVPRVYVGRYRLVAALGTGGVDVVYKAEDLLLGLKRTNDATHATDCSVGVFRVGVSI